MLFPFSVGFRKAVDKEKFKLLQFVGRSWKVPTINIPAAFTFKRIEDAIQQG